MAFLEAFPAALGAHIFNFSSTGATEGLVTLKAVLRIRHQVEADEASESLLEELLLAGSPTLLFFLLPLHR